MTELRLNGLTYQGVLNGVNGAWNSGDLVGVIGPNGAGKSTLLKVLTNVWAADGGEVLLDGRPVSQLSPRSRARRFAYLPQQVPEEVPFTVRQFVEMGRYAYRRGLAGLAPACRGAVHRAIDRLNLQAHVQTPVSQLSGGERQRVAIARCLAQEADVLVLDEPISNLDLFYQVEILQLLKSLAEEGYLVILAIHHLELAAQFCNRLLMLHHGTAVQAGLPSQVLTEQSLREVFGMEARIYEDPYSRSLRVSPVMPLAPESAVSARATR